MHCFLISSFLFISFRYKQHKTDFETILQQRPISLPCRVTGCPCRTYLYVPLNGTQPIRCRCKHFADQHSPAAGFICSVCELHYYKHTNRMFVFLYWIFNMPFCQFYSAGWSILNNSEKLDGTTLKCYFCGKPLICMFCNQSRNLM